MSLAKLKGTNKRLANSLRIKIFQSRRSESEPVGICYDTPEASDMEMTKLQGINDCSIDSTKSFPIPEINLEVNEGNGMESYQQNVSVPPSPGKISAHRKVNGTIQNKLLGIPPSSGTFSSSSPRPLRRTLSAKISNEYSPGSASPRIKRPTRPASLNIGNEFFGDSISVINMQAGNSPPYKEASHESPSISVLMSGVYAVFVIIFGCIIYVNDQHRVQKFLSEIFNSVLALMGLLWLMIFHVDLCLYKNTVLKQLKEREDAMQEASDRYSVATEFIINSGFDFSTKENKEGDKVNSPPYRFLLGRHSGSFYLKIGSACFCFGYLIYLGLQLGQHILNFVDVEKKLLNCARTSSVVLHVITPIYAFYQLFITFKYSNIVINKRKIIARFGLMHIIATCICNWFCTIVDEAVEDYTHMSQNVSLTTFEIASFRISVQRKDDIMGNPFNCSTNSILSTRSMSAIPYLYPFAIEFNLLLAGVWFIVWQNIGKEHSHADPHHLRHTISQDEVGSEAIAYQSNLVINADCHSANKGLFLGLFLLLTVVVTVIVFFVAMTTEGYESKAVSIHTGQEGILSVIGLLLVWISFYQIKKLDRSEHPITFLDDVLLFVPLPFFFIHGIMSVMAELANENYSRLILHIVVTFQVVVQTPFIIDGLRRCSNTQSLRYKKPGRELITFLIILNLTLWIVNTFELKSVEHFHGQGEYFGELVWLFIGHSTIPLMLFYRFHSSVCLADMWKSAYEKEL